MVHLHIYILKPRFNYLWRAIKDHALAAVPLEKPSFLQGLLMRPHVDIPVHIDSTTKRVISSLILGYTSPCLSNSINTVRYSLHLCCDCLFLSDLVHYSTNCMQNSAGVCGCLLLFEIMPLGYPIVNRHIKPFIMKQIKQVPLTRVLLLCQKWQHPFATMWLLPTNFTQHYLCQYCY